MTAAAPVEEPTLVHPVYVSGIVGQLYPDDPASVDALALEQCFAGDVVLVRASDSLHIKTGKTRWARIDQELPAGTVVISARPRSERGIEAWVRKPVGVGRWQQVPGAAVLVALSQATDAERIPASEHLLRLLRTLVEAVQQEATQSTPEGERLRSLLDHMEIQLMQQRAGARATGRGGAERGGALWLDPTSDGSC
jgi:hypothetical protein